MSMVFIYFIGALLQCLGSLCLGHLFYIGLKSKLPGNHKSNLFTAFAIGMIAESVLITLLSFGQILPIILLYLWFWTKNLYGLIVFWKYKRAIIQYFWVHKLFLFWFIILLSNASLPTSSYDNFTAHFAIARLFLENGGLPIRPDYQYLDALPLAAHMWYLPGLSSGFEGSANMVSGIFCLAFLMLIDAHWGRRCGWYAGMIALAMPEFIRVSFDPMVDTPCFFYALLGLAWIKPILSSNHPFSRPHHLLSGLCWSFLVAIKPTLAIFPIAWFALSLYDSWRTKQLNLKWALMPIALFAISGLWMFKNAYLYGNFFYPHLFAGHIAPSIPEGYRPPVGSFSISNILAYLKIIFLDHHWNLSLGPWPLICLPILLYRARRNRHFLIILLILITGFVLTFFVSSFKNRYFMPYLLLLLPWMACLVGRMPKACRVILFLTAILTFTSFVPYIAQPIMALSKNLDREAWYAFKFKDYPSFSELNSLPEGKILFVATPVYWLERDHIFSVYSETYIDYTRLKDPKALYQQLKALDIRFIVYDAKVISAMAENDNPMYSARRYCAMRSKTLLESLFKQPYSKMIQQNESGLWVAELK